MFGLIAFKPGSILAPIAEFCRDSCSVLSKSCHRTRCNSPTPLPMSPIFHRETAALAYSSISGHASTMETWLYGRCRFYLFLCMPASIAACLFNDSNHEVLKPIEGFSESVRANRLFINKLEKARKNAIQKSRRDSM